MNPIQYQYMKFINSYIFNLKYLMKCNDKNLKLCTPQWLTTSTSASPSQLHYCIPYSPRNKHPLFFYIALTDWSLCWRGNVSTLRLEPSIHKSIKCINFAFRRANTSTKIIFSTSLRFLNRRFVLCLCTLTISVF